MALVEGIPSVVTEDSTVKILFSLTIFFAPWNVKLTTRERTKIIIKCAATKTNQQVSFNLAPSICGDDQSDFVVD